MPPYSVYSPPAGEPPQKPEAQRASGTGSSVHAGGIKYDGQKIRPRLVLGTMARALEEVCKVATYGAHKYSDDNWLIVPEAHNRYTDALLRHQLAMARGEELDPESGLPHAAHAAWNSLAILDLKLRQQQEPA